MTDAKDRADADANDAEAHESGTNGHANGHANGSENPPEVEATSPSLPEAADLTEWITQAKSGLKSAVDRLVAQLDDGELFLPLRHPLKGVPEEGVHDFEGELTFAPHVLTDEEGNVFCSLFTRADLLERVEEQLGWETDDGPLEYCRMPAKAAFEVASEIVDDETVVALVINAMDDSELVLQRNEVMSIAQGQALPLVGYVRNIAPDDNEKTLFAELAEPPPKELIDALDACRNELPDVMSYRLEQTFNEERDLEPHPTLTLTLKRPDVDRPGIARHVVERIGGLVPDPGYIDILFEDVLSQN